MAQNILLEKFIKNSCEVKCECEWSLHMRYNWMCALLQKLVRPNLYLANQYTPLG